MGARQKTSTRAAGDEYELLVLELMSLLAGRSDVTTLRIERQVSLAGHGTTNAIDVLWEFVDASEQRHRVLFECRSYSRRLNQQALHAWRSVVDDVSIDPGWSTWGVVVTRIGYQSGAQQLADTYGIQILELREPTSADLANRLLSSRIDVRFRVPRFTDIGIELVERLVEDEEFKVWTDDIEVETADGVRRAVRDVLLPGELNSFDEPPREMHPVRREFDPPAVFLSGGRPLARIQALTAMVGESEATTEPVIVDHREKLAWMLKDTLTGSRVWFADDGRQWATDD